jgi:osomolarity two-component system sensor histidine kinase SLN1
MRFSLRLPPSVSVAPSGSTPAKSLQTTTTGTNDHSDQYAATELHLLPAPATAKDRQSRPRRNSKSVQINGGWRAYWAAFKRQVAPGTAPSSSSSPDDSTGTASYVHKPQGSATGAQDGRVQVVVVDRLWGENPGRSTESDSNEETHAENRLGTTTTDHHSSQAETGFWTSSPALFFLRWRIWPSIWGFFRLQFMDRKYEEHYFKETWFLRKRLALFSAAYFVINWLLPVILLTRPATLADSIFYYGVSGPGSLLRSTLSLTLP